MSSMGVIGTSTSIPRVFFKGLPPVCVALDREACSEADSRLVPITQKSLAGHRPQIKLLVAVGLAGLDHGVERHKGSVASARMITLCGRRLARLDLASKSFDVLAGDLSSSLICWTASSAERTRPLKIRWPS